MISAISWVPKGVSKSEPIVADPPPEEEIQELIANHKNARSFRFQRKFQISLTIKTLTFTF